TVWSWMAATGWSQPEQRRFAPSTGQFQHRPGLAAPILLTPIPYAITLPATQLGHTIHFGHGRPRFVASRTTILPGRPCASLPSVGRRTFFWPFGTGVTRRRGSLPRGRRRAGGARAAAPSAAGAGVRGGWRRAGAGESRARGGGAAARAQSGRAFAELDCGPPLAGVSPSSDANMLSIRGSTSSHCCGGRPMARSRIVGSSPDGSALLLFQ